LFWRGKPVDFGRKGLFAVGDKAPNKILQIDLRNLISERGVKWDSAMPRLKGQERGGSLVYDSPLWEFKGVKLDCLQALN